MVITFQDKIDAEALGRKYARTYKSHDATEGAVFCLIPDGMFEQKQLENSFIEGVLLERLPYDEYTLLRSIFWSELSRFRKEEY